MANITFNNQTTGFSMWLDEVMPKAVVPSVEYLYISTPNKYSIIFEGGPFTYSGTDIPLSGTVKNIDIRFPSLKATETPDIAITDLNVDITAYASLFAAGPSAADKTTAFWTATLSGNDTINFGANATQAGFNINFAGDGNVAPGEAVGVNDSLRGDVGGGIAAGDYFLVKQNQAAFGGNDDIRLEDSLGSTVVGDFYAGQANSKLFAGDDFVQLGQYGAAVFGDAVYLDGTMAAGDDTIIGGSRDDFLYGT
jgi:hypothetical protein